MGPKLHGAFLEKIKKMIFESFLKKLGQKFLM
jgi:hypothetical protein